MGCAAVRAPECAGRCMSVVGDVTSWDRAPATTLWGTSHRRGVGGRAAGQLVWARLKLSLGSHAHLGCPLFSSRPHCSSPGPGPWSPRPSLAASFTFLNLPVSLADTSRPPRPGFVPQVLPLSPPPHGSPALLPRWPLGHEPRAAGHQQRPEGGAERPRAAPTAGCRAAPHRLPPERGRGAGRRGRDPGPQLLGLCRRPSLLLGQGGRRAGEQAAGKLPGCSRCDQPQVRLLWRGWGMGVPGGGAGDWTGVAVGAHAGWDGAGPFWSMEARQEPVARATLGLAQGLEELVFRGASGWGGGRGGGIHLLPPVLRTTTPPLHLPTPRFQGAFLTSPHLASTSRDPSLSVSTSIPSITHVLSNSPNTRASLDLPSWHSIPEHPIS